MSFIVDHASQVYLLLAIAAAGCGFAWWLTKRARYLGFAALALALIALVWLLTRLVISDTKQIELNVHAMADALVARKADDLVRHISKEFNYKGLDRDTLHQRARAAIANHKVREVKITAFEIKDLSRAERKATARFRVSAWGADSETPYVFGTEADLMLEGDRWLLKGIRFFNPMVNQDQEIDLGRPVQ